MSEPNTSRAMQGMAKVHGKQVHARRVQVLTRHLAELIPNDLRVLDVGSGDGQVARLLMQLRPDLEIEGVDVLVRPDVAIPTTAFDGERLPFDDGAFDAVVMVDVLHHAKVPLDLLAETARVAKSWIVLKDHYQQGLAAHATLRFMDWVGNRAHGVSLPYNYLRPSEWRSGFERLGLKVDEERDHLGLYPWPANWLFERGLHFAARLGVSD